jgi:hypothetical protein
MARIEARNGKTVVIRNKPCHMTRPQTQRDQDRFNKRRRAQGDLFEKMTQLLTVTTGRKLSRTRLLELARTISEQRGIVLDRCATRLKGGLICWFCENANEILPDLLAQPNPPRPLVQRDVAGPDALFPDEETEWEFDSESPV